MNARGSARPAGSQAGFSLVEMLMTAVILAVGLLGLAMLQTVALRSRGTSQERTTAVQVAEQIMENVEAEGRNTWLNVADPTQAAPAALTALEYFTSNAPAAVTQYFDNTGLQLASAKGSVFSSNTTFVAVPSGTQGALSDVTVTVTFNEVNGQSQVTPHQVVLTRRVVHG